MNNNIEWHLYEQKDQFGSPVKPDNCRARVRSEYTTHQCQRKGKHEVEGFKFCHQHADRIRSYLGIESPAIKTVYYVNLNGNSIILADVIRETPQSYILDWRNSQAVFGFSGYVNSTVKKNSPNVFDTLDQAYNYMVTKYQESIEYHRKQIVDKNLKLFELTTFKAQLDFEIARLRAEAQESGS